MCNRSTRVTKYLKATLFLTTLFGLTLPMPAHADTVDPPAISARRASVYDVRHDHTLWKRFPAGDEDAQMGSTAKIVTIATALWAVRTGAVSLDDWITISEKAAKQGCNCFVPEPPIVFEGDHFLFPGDRMPLGDALYAVAMSDGEPTVAVAEFVAKAVLSGSKKPNGTVEDSAYWEQRFIDLMNERVDASGVGETTRFATVHGGDADETAQYTTTDDLITLWLTFADADPLFLEILGFREAIVRVEHIRTPGVVVPYVFDDRSYDWAPGLEGWKGGNSIACDACMIASAERAGRRVAVANMQAVTNFADAAEQFRYGFESIFEPELIAGSSPWSSVGDADIACLEGGYAATATISPENRVEVVGWRADRTTGRIDPILSRVSTLGFGGLRTRTGARDASISTDLLADSTAITRFEPTTSTSVVLKTAIPLAVRAEHVGDGYVAVGVETTDGLELQTWGIRTNDSALFRDRVNIGAGDQLALATVAPGLVVTVHRDNNNRFRLKTWRIDLRNGDLTPQRLDHYRGGSIRDVAIAGRVVYHGETHLVLSIRRASGTLRLISFGVDTANGQLRRFDEYDHGEVGQLDMVHVAGFGDDVFATVGRRPGGAVWLGIHRVDAAGQLEVVASGNIGLNVAGSSTIRVESLRARGVLVAVHQGGNSAVLELIALSIDSEQGISAHNRLAEESGLASQLYGTCVVADGQAELDLLVGVRGFLDSRLSVDAYRLGVR